MATPGYRDLDPDRIVATIEILSQRIGERFPAAGLQKVCRELASVARESRTRSDKIGSPNLPLRLVVGLIFAGSLWLLWQIIPLIDFTRTSADNVYTVLQGVEATMNILVLMGAAIFFLVRIEDRVKRERALEALNNLRSIIHVIDMHQLTKDPSVLLASAAPTASSPARVLSQPELMRYLDYCSEMLSLSAKVAALYGQSLPDPVVVDAVSDIERLTSNLSQKIWQKIMLIATGSVVAQPATSQSPQPDRSPGPPPQSEQVVPAPVADPAKPPTP
jgi:hypothetical protein